MDSREARWPGDDKSVFHACVSCLRGYIVFERYRALGRRRGGRGDSLAQSMHPLSKQTHINIYIYIYIHPHLKSPTPDKNKRTILDIAAPDLCDFRVCFCLHS